MLNPQIIVTINGTTYSLCADKPQAIGNMPAHDRLHLMALLEVIRQQGGPAHAQAPSSPRVPLAAPPDPAASLASVPCLEEGANAVADVGKRSAAQTRMGNGDIDALMATLAAEEQRSRQSGMTRAGIYKLAGGILLFTVLLVLLL